MNPNQPIPYAQPHAPGPGAIFVRYDSLSAGIFLFWGIVLLTAAGALAYRLAFAVPIFLYVIGLLLAGIGGSRLIVRSPRLILDHHTFTANIRQHLELPWTSMADAFPVKHGRGDYLVIKL
ncbi:MAG: hypothetical protein JWN40_5716, partial [Phycisphaerales bacterium]|nr:hypothetical protein [Phycisphaerales bacterium]